MEENQSIYWTNLQRLKGLLLPAASSESPTKIPWHVQLLDLEQV